MVARTEIPVANSAGLAMVSPATSNPCLTRDVFLPAMLNPARTEITCKAAGLPSATDLRPTHLNNFFRLTTTDDLQGPAAADYAFHTLHVLKAAVISDHEAYGQGLAMAFTARLQRMGGTVVGHLDLDPKKPDATSFLNAMKAAGAQAVYFGGITGDRGCTIRSEMTSIFPPGEATPYLSGDGIAEDPGCIRDAGNNSEGIYATAPVVDADSRATATQTIAAFKAAFGSTADYGPYTIVAYDATAVLYDALHRAIQAAGGQLPVRGNVTSQLSLTSGFAGATGTIGFDRAGDTTNRIVSVFEPTGSNPRARWKLVSAVDYSSVLPY
jgi:branched-chain amino acid transport system substrate-binding protein